MPAVITAPGPEAVRAILSDLFLRKPDLSKAQAPDLKRPCVIALYRGQEAQLVGAWVASMAFAATAGAALSLVPAALVEESVRSGKLAGPLEENVREVFNISARLFAGKENHRVSFAELILPPKAPPADYLALIAKPPARLDLNLDVNGYPEGRASLLFTLG